MNVLICDQYFETNVLNPLFSILFMNSLSIRLIKECNYNRPATLAQLDTLAPSCLVDNQTPVSSAFPTLQLLIEVKSDRNADNTRQTTTGVDEQDPLHRTWRE